MNLFGKYPAIVRSWDRARRECRVEIPGVTDGADILPLAELAYPLGDKSEHTELRIIVGDRVWVEFERGDPRHPIITHFRSKRTSNMALRRQWHHENIQWDADDEVVINAGSKITLNVGGTTYVMTPTGVTTTTQQITDTATQSLLTGTQTIQNGIAVSGDNGTGRAATFTGDFHFTAGTITHDSKVIDSTHTHPGDSGGTTGPVN